MKKLNIALTCGLFCIVFTASSQNEIIWETLGNHLNDDGKPEFIQRFTIIADQPVDGFAFCEYKRGMKAANSADTLIEVYPNYYYVATPRLQNINPGDTVIIDVISAGALQEHLNRAEGMHLVKNGKAIAAKNTQKTMTAYPAQWINPENGEDLMVYGEQAYFKNDSLRTNKSTSPYGQIPTLKKIELKDHKVNAKKLLTSQFKTTPIQDNRIDYWKATITDNGIEIQTNSPRPELIAERLKNRIIESADKDGNVPQVDIEDWTDYPYRGIMLDVGRNFLPKKDVMEYIDYMNRYDLNVLHFHLSEDGGWRLEIPSLPELTDVASKRGFTLTDDVPFLKGVYSGDGNPDSDAVSNGYYTVQDYIDILKYADSKGVTVIPEFDTPGHSRAAIRAMEWRAKHNGDSTYRLIHDGDTSNYRAPQDFYDNTMNPALEGPYKFWGTVFDDVIAIYNQAGIPLVAMNIGGDEVARGAWSGSDRANALMKEKGMKTQKDLHAYFVKRIAEIAKQKGVKLAGWEDIAYGYTPEFDAEIVPIIYGVNSWIDSESGVSQNLASKGYKVILSNVDRLYFDLHYTNHPDEPGMWWGGTLSEFDPLSATIDNLLPGDSTLQSNVIGVSGHVWGETIKDFPMVQRYTFPRILALAERAHNSHATIDNEQYFQQIVESMPEWDKEGIEFFVRQPGILIEEDGLIKMNEPYGYGEIRYTTDGSEPNKESALYTGPFKADTEKGVRAKLFVGNSSSVTSVQYDKK